MSTVQINYKSGQSVTLKDVVAFSVKKTSGSTEIQWDVGKNPKMRPLLIGVDEIESIWEVG